MMEPATLASAATWHPAISTEPARRRRPTPRARPETPFDAGAGLQDTPGEDDRRADDVALELALPLNEHAVTAVDQRPERPPVPACGQ